MLQTHAIFQHNVQAQYELQGAQNQNVEFFSKRGSSNWAVLGNQAADASALRARDNLDPRLLALWAQLKTELNELRRFGRDLHQFFVAVGTRAVQSTQKPEPVQPAGLPAKAAQICDEAISQLAQMTMQDLPRKFHNEDAQKVMEWIPTLLDGNSPVVWVTFHQLLVDFQIHSNRIGPRFEGKKWFATADDTDYCYKKQVAWFSRFLQGIGGQTAEPLKIQQCRPSSHVLNFWCGAVQVHFDLDRLQRLDSFYQHFAKRLPVRQIARDLAGLPPGHWPI